MTSEISAESREADVKSASRKSSQVLWRYLRALGPGLITGASDDDPSGIATYSQAGAQYGLAFLWTALLTLPLSAIVQEMCDRTALATGTGLGELSKRRFGHAGRLVVGILLVALVIANALNIAADLIAVGSGMQLLGAGPSWIWALVAGIFVSVLLAAGSFGTIAVVFRLLCISLFAYLVVAITVTTNWGSVVSHTLFPDVQPSTAYFAILVAVLGTTISPYLFFWQNANRIEEMRAEQGVDLKPQPLKKMTFKRARVKQSTARFDVFTGMTFSNVVMFAIILSTAETLNAHHKTNIQSAAQAAQALAPFAGRFASAAFALGFIGSGLLAIPVLAAAGSTGLSGLLGKDSGLSQSLRSAPVFYALVGLGTLGGTALSLIHVDPIKLLILVAVINGVAAAPFLIVVIMIANNRQIMGKYVNGRVAKIGGWLTALLMAVAAVAFFATGGLSS